MWWGVPRQCPCQVGLQGPHLPMPPPRLTLSLSPASLLQDWLLNSDFSFLIQASVLLRGSRIWGDGPQPLALGVSITRPPPVPSHQGQLGEEMPLTRAGCCWDPASGRGQPPAPKPRVPLNASAAAQPGLAEEAWWRMEICWAPPSPIPPCCARAGSGEDALPVPATRFACDKASLCQDQWPSLQPAPGG